MPPRLTSAIAIALGLLLSTTIAPPALGQEPPKPGVLFTGKDIPQPPQSGKEWTPPQTSLPETWTSAVQLLLSYGFADPRGCEYREVELTCGRISWSKSVLVATHAWVLPLQETDPPDAPRFAVAWNGIVYPVVSMGALADLHVDVERQLHARPYFFTHEEDVQVSCDRPLPLKGCLLLVLGEGDLAEQLWKVAPPTGRSGREKPVDLNFDPYLELVHEWAWAQHDHAIGAHLRGDDVVSFTSAKTLVALRDAVEKAAPERGFEHHPASNDHFYLEFLNRVHILADDAARRVAANPVERVLAPDAAPIADQAARIAALIRDLETVDQSQVGHPAGFNARQSPLIKALVKEGLPAVEPLLDCLEHDTRLTRSVQYHRAFWPGREYLTVKRPAGAALQDILKGRDIGRTFREKREFCRTRLTQIDAEHWFTILAWDKSTGEEWLEAAQHLVEPAPPGPEQPAELTDLPQTPGLAGEAMRSRRNPSIIGLLDKRAESLAWPARDSPREIRDFQHACQSFQLSCRLTVCLAKWDLPCGLPEVRRRIRQFHDLEQDPQWAPYTPQLHADVSRLFIIAIDAGAADLVDAYFDWMTRLTPDPLHPATTLEVFHPLSRLPHTPKSARLAHTLFSSKSPWLPLHLQLGPRWDGLLTSPLIAVPAFCRVVISQLSNQTSYGKATLDPESLLLDLRVPDGRRSELVSTAFNPREPQPTDTQKVRLCDFMAWRLSHLQGAPRFELWWPKDQRDDVLPSMVQFVNHWGHAFRESGPPTEKFASPDDQARFHLPQLKEPATQDDVDTGRALFTLRRPGAEVRLVPLPALPQPARWKELTQFPIQTLGPVDPTTGKPPHVKSFDQAGTIWQAEEVLTDGIWKRYYGFLGNHIVAKVPAEDVELLEKAEQP